MPVEETAAPPESPGQMLAREGTRAINSLVEGDRWLRRLSVMRSEWPGASLFFSPRMHIRLNIFGQWTQERIRFIWLKVGQTRRAADIRLGFQLRPAPDPRDMGSRWLQPLFVVPSFLLNPGEPGRLLWRLGSGGTCDVRLSGNRIAATTERDRQPAMIGKWGWKLVMDLLETLNRPLPGREVPFTLIDSDNPDDIDSIGSFLRLCFEQYDGLWAQLEKKAADHDPVFQPYYPPAYVIDRLDARIRAWIGRDGRIISHAGKSGGIEVEMEVDIDTAARGQCARFRSSPAGAPLSDVHCRNAIEAMRKRARDIVTAAKIPEMLGVVIHLPGEEESQPEIDSIVEEFRKFLNPRQQQASFFRLNAANLELAILKGDFRGKPGMLAMTVPFILEEEDRVSLSEDRSGIKVLASSLPGTLNRLSVDAFELGQSAPLRTYIESTLRQLEAWQRRMEKAA